MADFENPQQSGQQHLNVDNDPDFSVASSSDERTDEQKKQDAELAERLSSIIEAANEKVIPLCKMIRKVR